jgi:hypothetical protein
VSHRSEISFFDHRFAAVFAADVALVSALKLIFSIAVFAAIALKLIFSTTVFAAVFALKLIFSTPVLRPFSP